MWFSGVYQCVYEALRLQDVIASLPQQICGVPNCPVQKLNLTQFVDHVCDCSLRRGVHHARLQHLRQPMRCIDELCLQQLPYFVTPGSKPSS